MIRTNNSIVTGRIRSRRIVSSVVTVSADPEGSLYAGPGDMCIDTTTDWLYMKTTALELNTGWVFIAGAVEDWTDVDPTSLTGGWTAGGWDSRVRYRKNGRDVEVEACLGSDGFLTSSAAFRLPAGYRPLVTVPFVPVYEGAISEVSGYVDSSGFVRIDETAGNGNYFVGVRFPIA